MDHVIRKLTPIIEEIFHHLHTHPEISGEENETTKYIQSLFAKKDCKITTFPDSTGLVIEIGSGSPVIGLRADIDALWQEVDGTFQANHSCGHDAHMTIVIGVLLTLLESKHNTKGTFRFIFQPAEETGEGALSFVEKGVADDLDYLYGMHLRPIEELKNGQFAPAIQHGAARTIRGEIRGEDAHGARPHLNANAIQVGMEFFQALNNLYINPMIPHSVKMTSFQAGGKSTNIIPGNAMFTVDMRSQTNEGMEELTDKVKKIGELLAKFHGIDIDLSTESDVAAAVLNDEAIANMTSAIKETVGEANFVPTIVTTGGDDFHFYTIKRPKLKATMLAIGCDLQPGLHHPHMSFNHEAIPTSVSILTKALIQTANSNQ